MHIYTPPQVSTCFPTPFLELCVMIFISFFEGWGSFALVCLLKMCWIQPVKPLLCLAIFSEVLSPFREKSRISLPSLSFWYLSDPTTAFLGLPTEVPWKSYLLNLATLPHSFLLKIINFSLHHSYCLPF